MHQCLKTKINEKRARIGVVGLGYVGLPLIRAFVQAGFNTLGFDIDPQKVHHLMAGQSYIGHIPSEWIARCIHTAQFESTTTTLWCSMPI